MMTLRTQSPQQKLSGAGLEKTAVEMQKTWFTHSCTLFALYVLFAEKNPRCFGGKSNPPNSMKAF